METQATAPEGAPTASSSTAERCAAPEPNGQAVDGGAAAPVGAPVRAAWLCVADAAARLGVSPRTVRRRIESGEVTGELRALESGGRAWFVSLPEGNDRAKNDRAAKEADSVRTGERTANGQRAAKRTDNVTKRSNERENGRTDSERTARGQANGQRAAKRTDSVRPRKRTGPLTEREPTRRELEQQEEIRFLRATVEQLQRDGAEVRAALRAALKLAAPETMPQLPAQSETTAPQPERARPVASPGAPRAQAQSAPDREPKGTGAALSYDDIADALERDLRARGL